MQANTAAKRTETFYDKSFEWKIEKGPLVLLGIILLIVVLWLIKVLARWMERRMHHKQLNSSLRPFFLDDGAAHMSCDMPVMPLDLSAPPPPSCHNE